MVLGFLFVVCCCVVLFGFKRVEMEEANSIKKKTL